MWSTSLTRDPATYFLDQYFKPNDGGINGLNIWQDADYDPYGTYPGIGYNATGADQHLAIAITWPASTILAHPPTSSQMAIIAWRSPLNGYVSISGAVSDDDPGGGDGILWFIDQNTTNLAFGGFVNGSSQTFAAGTGGAGLNSVAVSIGDMVYLAIHPNGNYYFDTTRVDLAITVTSPPTPTSTPTLTPGNTPTSTPTETFTPAATFTPTETSTSTPIPTPTAINTPTGTPSGGTCTGGAHCYAMGGIYGSSYKGAWAKIEWADPQVRDGGFSAETLWVQNGLRWVEVGWTKEAPPGKPWGTYLYYAYDDGTNYYPTYLEATSSTNTYEISYSSGNSWNIYINSALRATVDAGFSTATDINAGGEVTSNVNAMGVAGTLLLQYKDTSNNWAYWSNTRLTWFTPYIVDKIGGSDYNLQNYGTN